MEKFDYVIDIEGFHDKDGYFSPKEIAVVSTCGNFSSHWIMKPSCDITQLSKGMLATNSYLTCYHHGIEWFDGESNLDDVYDVLREVARNALRIYVLLARQVINLEEYKCPSYRNLPRINEHYCFYHGRKKENFCCALSYAYKLRDWLNKSLASASPSTTEDEQEVEFLRKKKNNQRESVAYREESRPRGAVSKPAVPVRASAPPTTAASATPIAVKGNSGSGETGGGGRVGTDPLYDSVIENELAADTKSTCACAGSDGRSVSSRQDTGSLGEALCACI